jgi:HK97 family phage prohead protease
MRWISREPREAIRSNGGDCALDARGRLALRSGDGAGADQQYLGTLHGHFAVFNVWTEINSGFEGNFMESIAPGAFKQTMAENKSMRCLYAHGTSRRAGLNPLGPITTLREDPKGAYYEVPLFDTSFNRDFLPGLRAGVYGASFRFQVQREEVRQPAFATERNPRQLEERLLVEVRVAEFGPTPFPAYSDATASMRHSKAMLELERALQAKSPAVDDDSWRLR